MGVAAARFAIYALLSAGLVVVLVATNILVLRANDPNRKLGPHYYVAVGDSLSYGFQPNLDFRDGFVDGVTADLQTAEQPLHITVENYACAGEKTTTMINGGCPGNPVRHINYSGPQLNAVVSFLEAHRGQVSPVTLEIGANDVLPDFSTTTCSVSSSGDADLALLDQNLTQTILPRLIAALQTPDGHRAGDLHILNYYNPYAQKCPNSVDFIHTLNSHIAADAGQFLVPVVDVYAAFGGDAQMAHNVCATQSAYTWICDAQFRDIHPTTTGYGVIAAAVEGALAYPGLSPVKHLPATPPSGKPTTSHPETS
jgi:lysophospholipase L1-like esterase